MERFMQKVHPEPNSGCWLWVGSHERKRGYGWLKLGRKEEGQDGAHRISHRLFKGPIPTGSVVCHKCDTPACVNPDHLFLGSPQENMQDCIKKGRFRRGKLNPEKVDLVRKRLASGETHQSIATGFGVSDNAISDIKRGVTYTGVY